MKNLIGLVLVALLAAGNMTAVWAMGDAGFVQQTLVGKKAQDFTLRTVRDQKINLAKHTQGKKAIVVFWATWCPHCRVAVQEISAKGKDIAANNIAVVFVSVGEPAQTVGRYLEQHGYDFDVALDEDQGVSDAYRLIGVPTLVYIDEQGNIRSVEYQFSADYNERFK